MESERIVFSPRAYTPPTLEEKKFKLETERFDLEQAKEPFLERKLSLERQLSEIKLELKTTYMDGEDYRKAIKAKAILTTEKFKIEDQIKEFNKKQSVVNREIDELVHLIKKVPDDNVRISLLELRDKYMSFASDTTRVSSMRAMSSKFVEEIQAILKVIK